MFVSHCTDALMASVFVTIYIVVYSTQSPNIALLSCLLRTLGIVNCFMLNILSCLLWTLAVWYLATVARNLCRAFYYVPQTYHITSISLEFLVFYTQIPTTFEQSLVAPPLLKFLVFYTQISMTFEQSHASSLSLMLILLEFLGVLDPNFNDFWTVSHASSLSLTLISLEFLGVLDPNFNDFWISLHLSNLGGPIFWTRHPSFSEWVIIFIFIFIF